LTASRIAQLWPLRNFSINLSALVALPLIEKGFLFTTDDKERA